MSTAKPRLYELFYASDKGTARMEMATRDAALTLARRLSTQSMLVSACWATQADFEAKWVKRWIRHFGKPEHSGKAVRLVLNRDAFFFDTMHAFCKWLDEPAMHSHEKYDKHLEAIVFIQVDAIWPFLAKMDPRKVPKKSKVHVRVEGCFVEADGMRLAKVNEIMEDLPCINMTTTNVRDIVKYQGIEAARQSLFDQASRLDAFADVSPRHLSLLCDAMCASGKLMATNFNGMGDLTTSTLGKAVFQSPIPTFVNAAVTKREEQFDNISACIISGERVPTGTGANFTLIMDDGLTAKGEWTNPLQALAWYQPL
jgi:hypothetical protein